MTLIPTDLYLGFHLVLLLCACFILARKNSNLTIQFGQLDGINRELHGKLDDAEATIVNIRQSADEMTAIIVDLQAGFHELKMENDRLQGEVLK